MPEDALEVKLKIPIEGISIIDRPPAVLADRGHKKNRLDGGLAGRYPVNKGRSCALLDLSK
jgi:hypothetical protein